MIFSFCTDSDEKISAPIFAKSEKNCLLDSLNITIENSENCALHAKLTSGYL